MATKKKTDTPALDAASKLQALRAQYTMSGRAVETLFGLSRQHFQGLVDRGVITLRRVQFAPTKTAPFYYDPEEVQEAFERYVAGLEEQIAG